MSQTSPDIAHPAELLALAGSRSVDDRQRLMLGVVALCNANPPTDGCAPVLSDIFLALARDAETRIRQTLAEQLADAAWAPRAMIDLLMMDEIDIARPVIARSPLMRDEDLLRILVDATLDHQVEVARRPHISERVADAVIGAAIPAPMAALAANTTAVVSPDGLHRLVEHARRVAALRAPLARHPALNHELATTLYAMVGDALRTELQARFVDMGPALPEAIAAAIESAARPRSPAMTVLLTPSGDSAGDRDEIDRRLVDKLRVSGDLRPGFLVRALREKQLGLFEHGLAGLSGFPIVQVRQAIQRPSPDALYLACASIGIDRAVFPTVLKELRDLTGGLPGQDVTELMSRTLTPVEAGYAFRLLMETETGLPV